MGEQQHVVVQNPDGEQQHVGIPIEDAQTAATKPPAPEPAPERPARPTPPPSRRYGNHDMPDNCCCACFTCWAAQPFYLVACIKGIIASAIIAPVVCISFFVICLLMWGHDIVYTYRAISKTKVLGPNLKALALLLLPVPLLLYPFLVAVGGIFAGVFIGFGGAARLPKDTSCACGAFVFLHTCTANLPYTGFKGAFTETAKQIRGFWKFMTHSYFTYLQELIFYDGESYDIRLIQLLIALIVAPLGGLLCLVGFTLMLWKLPIALIRAEWEVFKAYFKGKGTCFEACLFFIPWLIGLAVTPAGVLLAGGISPVGGLLFGFTMAGITSYQARTILGMFPAGLCAAYQGVYYLDRSSNDVLFGKDSSCLVKWKYEDVERMGHRNMGSQHAAAQAHMNAGCATGGQGASADCEGAEVGGASGAVPSGACGDVEQGQVAVSDVAGTSCGGDSDGKHEAMVSVQVAECSDPSNGLDDTGKSMVPVAPAAAIADAGAEDPEVINGAAPGAPASHKP